MFFLCIEISQAEEERLLADPVPDKSDGKPAGGGAEESESGLTSPDQLDRPHAPPPTQQSQFLPPGTYNVDQLMLAAVGFFN